MTKKQDWLYEDDDMMGEPEKEEKKEKNVKKEINQKDKQNEPVEAAEDVKELNLTSRQDLEEELNKMEKLVDEYKEKYLHARAETDTVRRRSYDQIDKEKKYAVSSLLEELIPILDSFNQSVATVQESDHEMVTSMREGMVLTLQMLHKALAKYGVKEINPGTNELFNPSYHEVMMAQENAGVPPNTILSVLQKGYQLHERVIRPARVIVAKAAN